MEDHNDIKLKEIDIREIASKIASHKKLYALTLGIAFVISTFIILCVPRYYVCSVKLAPETTNANMLGNISSLASSFGLNMNNMSSQDDIIPEFYPDVMESVDFQTNMFPVKIETKDKKIKTTYYDYLNKYQKLPWWSSFIGLISGTFKKDDKNDNNIVNPFSLTKKQNDIAQLISRNVKSQVDKKTNVITITVEDQDPLVCATIADSAMIKLQQFIIKYRTSKAMIDLRHAQALCEQAKAKYVKAQETYASYADANEDVVLQSFKSKQDEMENEMQLQYNNYQLMTQQVQLARAKLQERTPAFTTLQSPTVPLKPAGPKRMIFITVVLVITFLGTSVYVYRKPL